MSSSVFLDTNGWITLLNSTEQLHKQANDLWLELGRSGYRIVLTDWIIAETGNGLARSTAREHFTNANDRISRNSAVQIVFINAALIEKAAALYKSYADKSWGLVDCASFVVMRERGITDAFTSDHDFEQAGFRCMLTA
jgi:predicted nucleic acid-binding protein